MIKSVKITSLSEAEDMPFKANLEQNLWISAIDPEDEQIVKKLNTRFSVRNIKHFYQLFRDWSDEDQEPYIKQKLETEGPQERHVNNIISFLEPFVISANEYNLGVNCFVGISRSTAIGIIAWVMQGKTAQEALSEILKVRREAWPNLRILQMASIRLGVDLFTPVQEWKKENGSNIIT